MNFEGTWHIKEMEMWDEDYFNMDVQAYIEIESNGSGNFQFGLVSGNIDGKTVKYPNGNRFEFSWQGSDEYDPVSGSGWLQIQEHSQFKGEFRFFEGDDSTFIADKLE
jgi:hypothetical protein